jgi:L-lactate utilization protein LutB
MAIMREFRQRIKNALENPILQEALSANAERRLAGRSKAFESLTQADLVRAEARAIRQSSIQQLEALHQQFASILPHPTKPISSQNQNRW